MSGADIWTLLRGGVELLGGVAIVIHIIAAVRARHRHDWRAEVQALLWACLIGIAFFSAT